MKLEPYSRLSQYDYTWNLKNIGRCNVPIPKPTNLACSETKLSRKINLLLVAPLYLPSIMHLNTPGSPDFPRALGVPYSGTIFWARFFQKVVDVPPVLQDIFYWIPREAFQILVVVSCFLDGLEKFTLILFYQYYCLE